MIKAVSSEDNQVKQVRQNVKSIIKINMDESYALLNQYEKLFNVVKLNDVDIELDDKNYQVLDDVDVESDDKIYQELNKIDKLNIV